jgi:outer membrane protein
MQKRIWERVRSSYLLKHTGLALLFFCSVSVASGQGFYAAGLSLEKAVETAIEKNPQTRLSESRAKIADLKLKEAGTDRLPTAQFTQSITRSNDPVFIFSSLLKQGRFSAGNFALHSLNDPKGMFDFQSGFTARMPLFDQHQTRAKVDQAEIGKERTELEAESIRQQLRYQVIRKFYGAILDRELVNVAAEAVKSADANAKKAKDMVDVGMTTDADYLAALVERANAGQSKIEAESAFAVTLAELNLTLGARPDIDHFFVGDLQEKYFPVADQGTLIETALKNRPDYLAAEFAIRSSQRETKAIRDTRLPRVDAFGSFNYNSPYITNGSTDYTVGVSVTYSLFDAGRKLRIDQAAEAESSAETEKQVVADQITGEVVRAYENHKTAKAKIAVSVRSIAQAEEALQIIQDRYKSGLSTFDRVVASEAALVKAKHNLLAARYEYLVGYASVLLATGQLRDAREFD